MKRNWESYVWWRSGSPSAHQTLHIPSNFHTKFFACTTERLVKISSARRTMVRSGGSSIRSSGGEKASRSRPGSEQILFTGGQGLGLAMKCRRMCWYYMMYMHFSATLSATVRLSATIVWSQRLSRDSRMLIDYFVKWTACYNFANVIFVRSLPRSYIDIQNNFFWHLTLVDYFVLPPRNKTRTRKQGISKVTFKIVADKNEGARYCRDASS